MHFKIYRDTANYWRWTLYATNNKKIADSGEGYNNKADCQAGINLAKSTNTATPVLE